jgi:hypothetical protein
VGFLTRKDASDLIEKYGFLLFPTHGIVNGACTCSTPDCHYPGKHPLTSDGFYSATKDIDKLVALIGVRRGVNLAVRTGAESGIFVIDIDGPEGEESWKQALGGNPEPNTLTVKTGRGRHLYFKHISGILYAKHLGNKIDIKSDGGYVMAPGCNHISGNNYYITNNAPIAIAPDWLASSVKRNEVKVTAGLNLINQIKSALNIGQRYPDDEIERMLSFISPDIGNDEWVSIGMALHDGGYPFHIWDSWSKKGSKYTGDTGTRWKSFHTGGGVSVGSLVKMAKDGGYTQTTKELVYREKPEPLPQKEAVKAPDSDTLQDKKIGVSDSLPQKSPDITIESPRSHLYYVKDTDIEPSISTSDFVQGLLTDGALSVIYGPSNCGKTFFMTDLAFHVATGKQWRGKRVEQGGVIYVALEGSYGLTNRVSAYKSKVGPLGGQFAMVPCQVDFFNPDANLAEFIALLKTAQQDIGNIKLIVIDTLARAIAGGDENSGKDMGMLIKHADLIRMTTGAHVSFIHHSGKDDSKGARGHSSLRAATDTEIEISRAQGEDFSRVRVSKQREMEMIDEVQFKLAPVLVGRNRYGEDVTSCVVEPYEAAVEKKNRLKPGSKEANALEIIRDLISTQGYHQHGPDIPAGIKGATREMIRARLLFRGIYEKDDRKAFTRIMDNLISKNYLVQVGEYVWINT